MLAFAITNISSDDAIPATDLPPPFNLNGEIAASATVTFVVQVHDLDKVVNNHSGFTSADILQQMRQANRISLAISDVGDDEDVGSIFDEAVAVAA